MANLSPADLISMLKNGANPQQLTLSVLEGQMSNSPIGQNLLNLARRGDSRQIEQIARNMVAQRGLDFDTEFNSFKQLLGIK